MGEEWGKMGKKWVKNEVTGLQKTVLMHASAHLLPARSTLPILLITVRSNGRLSESRQQPQPKPTVAALTDGVDLLIRDSEVAAEEQVEGVPAEDIPVRPLDLRTPASKGGIAQR